MSKTLVPMVTYFYFELVCFDIYYFSFVGSV